MNKKILLVIFAFSIAAVGCSPKVNTMSNTDSGDVEVIQEENKNENSVQGVQEERKAENDNKVKDSKVKTTFKSPVPNKASENTPSVPNSDRNTTVENNNEDSKNKENIKTEIKNNSIENGTIKNPQFAESKHLITNPVDPQPPKEDQ